MGYTEPHGTPYRETKSPIPEQVNRNICCVKFPPEIPEGLSMRDPPRYPHLKLTCLEDIHLLDLLLEAAQESHDDV